jgi:hypothetical protein
MITINKIDLMITRETQRRGRRRRRRRRGGGEEHL